MRRSRVWLEIGIIVVGIALMAAWMRPRVEQPKTGLRFLGKNAKGYEEYENLRDGTVLIKIPAGTFTMGSNDGEDKEKPPHSVTLPSFLMARVPVTNTQFARFVSETSFDAGSEWKSHASKWGDQAPVVHVSWHDATAYCTWAGLRLPTEEEWEMSARGTESLVFPWGNEWDASRCRSSVGGSVASAGSPAAVGSFPSGASPFGCLDMAGNVWQWTSSWYDRYPGYTIPNNRFDPNSGEFGQTYRVVRGGSWYLEVVSIFRGALRGRSDPGVRSRGVGFRCARNP